MPSKYKEFQRLILAFSSLTITILIILYPKQSLSASLKGLNTWFNIVLPALLPFFIVSDIMIELGVVEFLSRLLNPIMKPVFNCPGQSSFVWIMSITSGYPMGPRLIASLYQGGSITKAEGQRMLAFCNTSGPLFMIGAVGIGMLGSQEAGKLIAISHYLASLLVGILFRFYRKEEPRRPIPREISNKETTPPKSLGTILGDSVRNSMESQLLIGGFIILFSVIINLVIKGDAPHSLAPVPHGWAFAFSSGSQLIKSLGAGILEITTGCQLLGESTLPFETKLVLASFIIGWGGFSIHSQAISLLANTDFSIGLYFIAKLSHGAISAIITYTWLIFSGMDSVPAFGGPPSAANITMINTFMASLQLLGSAILTFIALYLLSLLLRALRN